MFVSVRVLHCIAGAVALCATTVAAADTAYVANAGPSGTGPSTVSVIDTGSNTVIRTINVGDQPRTIAANPQTRMVYVANEGNGASNGAGGSVSVIDGRTNTVVATIPFSFPYGIATAGQRAYVAGFSNAVSVISATTNSVIATIPIPGGCCGVGAEPLAIAATPSGSRVYTANFIASNGTTTSQQWGTSTVGDIPLPAPPAYIRSHF